MRTQTLLLLFVVTIPLFLSGCQRIGARSKLGYSTMLTTGNRDFERARAKHDLAIERMCEDDPDAAEQLLREALICDPDFGPAHNSLGKIYFDQQKFYLAAWEFEFALKLMPERPEPLNNLGLVFEAVGNFEKAIEYFDSAWAIEDDNAQFLGNLLRTRIRNGERPVDLHGFLQRLIEIDDRTEWVDWARGQMVLHQRNEPSSFGKNDEPKTLNLSGNDEARPTPLVPIRSKEPEIIQPIERDEFPR